MCFGCNPTRETDYTQKTIELSSLDLTKLTSGFEKPQINKNLKGSPISISGITMKAGIVVKPRSVLWVDLGPDTDLFQAELGIEDSSELNASIQFTFLCDGKILWKSGKMLRGNPSRKVAFNVSNHKQFVVVVTDMSDGIFPDSVAWINAQFVFKKVGPSASTFPDEPMEILTPAHQEQPKINGPKIYGVRPTHPFLYRIPTTGERPIHFEADFLPSGIELDQKEGILSGKAPQKGEYSITIHAINRYGSTSRVFRIISGDILALTPPMGWNHWYAFYCTITDEMIREAASLLVSSGMADVGYQYINIDGCWANAPENTDPLRTGPLRDGNLNLLPNKYFPNMKKLTDYVHSLGLKAGIYGSPAPFDCAGFVGNYQNEARDARLFADWGFDFLKYDWCYYDELVPHDQSLEAFKNPYRIMGQILQSQERDLVFNLCQYGRKNVWEWATEVGGHTFRTAGDLGYELDRLMEVALQNARVGSFSGPGRWTDPDYIQIGYVGNANTMGAPQKTTLSFSEQYSFMSLWALMSAPLFYSGDIKKLDLFGLRILTNTEVIDINQDSLGRPAIVVRLDDEVFVMTKQLEDGSKAIGFFNQAEIPVDILVDLEKIGLNGKHRIRDLWRQKELGTIDGELAVSLKRRGVFLIRVWPEAIPVETKILMAKTSVPQ